MTDVCGLASAATDTALAVKNLMKRHVNSIRHTKLTTKLYDRFRAEAEEGTYSSAVMLTYFSPTRSLAICNAGGPPPLVYRVATGQWSFAKGELGGKTPDVYVPGTIPAEEYRHSSTQLDAGDEIMIYGNSLADCRDAQGRVIGVVGIQERVEALQDCPRAEVPSQLIDSIRGENAENGVGCDLTVLLAQATRTNVGWKRNILAPLRILRPVDDHTDL